MKKIGIVGGIGPESTIEYYKGIIDFFNRQQADFGYPEILIYSADLAALLRILDQKDWESLSAWLLEKVTALYRAGAEFAVIGSNTPHVVFDRVRIQSPIPMISIVEETCKTAKNKGLQTLGLLGTRLTMESDFYKIPFQNMGMTIVTPDHEDRELIHHRLFSEIELGVIRDSTRQELLAIIKKMVDHYSITGLILGCTELPLILDRDAFGIPFLNTTAIHVNAIINMCLERKV